MLDSINLLSGLTQKMDYLQTRQRVLAENLSNSNTPGFQAHDIKAPDFAATLGLTKNNNASSTLALAVTSPNHINSLSGGFGSKLKSEASKQTYEVTPEGNSVSIEEQMMKSSQNNIDYQLVTNLYNKNLGMLNAAIKG